MSIVARIRASRAIALGVGLPSAAFIGYLVWVFITTASPLTQGLMALGSVGASIGWLYRTRNE